MKNVFTRDFLKLFCKKFCGFLMGLLNVFLTLVFIVFLSLLLAIIFDAKFGADERVGNFIKNKFAEKGLDFDFEKLTFDMSGRIQFHEPSMRFHGSGADFFRAKSLGFHLSVSSLILGRLDLLDFRLEDALLKAASGEESYGALFEDISAHIIAEGNACFLEGLSFRSGNVYFNAKGDFDKSFLSGNFASLLDRIVLPDAKKINEITSKLKGNVLDKKQSEEPAAHNETLPQKWDKFCFEVFKYRQQLSGTKISEISLDFVCTQARGFSLFLGANFGRYEYKGKSGKNFNLTAENIRYSLLFDSQKNPNKIFIFANGENLDSSLGAKAEKITFYSSLNLQDLAFQNTRINCVGLRYDGLNAPLLSLAKDSISMDDYLQDLHLLLKLEDSALSANLSGEVENLKIDFDGSLDLNAILKFNQFPLFDELSQFDFACPLYLLGGANINLRKLEEFTLKASVDISDARVMNNDTSYIFSDISFDMKSGDFTAVDSKIFTKEGWSIGGVAIQNIKDFSYVFYLDGNLAPMSIAHFMEDWWVEAFSETQFVDAFPYANVSVKGTWGDPEHIYVYGSVYGEKVLRNKVVFDSVSLVVWVNPSRITLMDALIKNEGRQARGNLEWLYFSNQIDNYNENRIYAAANMTRRELIGLGGQKVEEAIKVLDFDSAPEVSVKLLLPSAYRYPDAQDKMNVDFKIAGNVKVAKRIELKDLSCRAYIDGDNLWLDNVRAKVSDGDVYGSLFAAKKNGLDWISLNVDLQNANQLKFINFLSELDGEDNAASSADSAEIKGINEYDILGRISGNMELSGFVDDAKSFKGKGAARIDNAKLSELHLLGLVSRAASAIGVPLATFDLNKAVSSIEISDGIVSFDDFLITGPSAEIAGHAYYDFTKGSINSQAILSPFGNVETSLVTAVIKIADPFMSTLEINMRGAFENPDISLSLKPLNFFRSNQNIIKKLGENIDAEEKKDKDNNADN